MLSPTVWGKAESKLFSFNPGDYLVSIDGDILSMPRTKRWADGRLFHIPLKLLKKTKFNVSYLSSSIGPIHRVVGMTFIPNPENKPQINHIDGNPSNNRLENLEWCTQVENQLHAVRTGLQEVETGKKNLLALSHKRRDKNRVKLESHLGSNFINYETRYGVGYVIYSCAFCKSQVDVRADMYTNKFLQRRVCPKCSRNKSYKLIKKGDIDV